MAKVFTLILPSIYRVENLYIYRPRYLPLEREDEVENGQWLEIFRLFRTVKNLYVTKEFARYIFPSLKKLVGERVADVLPALENFFLEQLQTPAGWEPVHWQEAIGPFVAARQLSGHPVAISRWDGI